MNNTLLKDVNENALVIKIILDGIISTVEIHYQKTPCVYSVIKRFDSRGRFDLYDKKGYVIDWNLKNKNHLIKIIDLINKCIDILFDENTQENDLREMTSITDINALKKYLKDTMTLEKILKNYLISIDNNSNYSIYQENPPLFYKSKEPFKSLKTLALQKIPGSIDRSKPITTSDNTIFTTINLGEDKSIEMNVPQDFYYNIGINPNTTPAMTNRVTTNMSNLCRVPGKKQILTENKEGKRELKTVKIKPTWSTW